MPRAKSNSRSQVLDLLFAMAEALGASTDREVSALVGVTPENVANWRAGTVKELKRQTLEAVKQRLSDKIASLGSGHRDSVHGLRHRLIELEIEEDSAPDALQRSFADRIHYDYLGHRFLYYEPQGALAWENLIRADYERHSWLEAVTHCATEWLSSDGDRRSQGPLARALHLGTTQSEGLELISLGPGEGAKEALILRTIVGLKQRPAWSSVTLVDVSIPLLTRAARAARTAVLDHAADGVIAVRACCADFEEGEQRFVERLPSQENSASAKRLVLMLGNTFGNLKSEDEFLNAKLNALLRPEDALWLEVAERPERIEDDPLYPLLAHEGPTDAAAAHRQLLLEGPFRRFEAARRRDASKVSTRVWLRENDRSATIPKSINFCHDLVIEDEGRVSSMLYSRRYDIAALTAWLDKRGYEVRAQHRVVDAQQSRVHLLCFRR